MPSSRREFLTYGSAGLLGAAIQAKAQASTPVSAAQSPDLPPGAPPAFGTAPPVGPEVTAATFAEAEKLVQVEMTPANRATAGRRRSSHASTSCQCGYAWERTASNVRGRAASSCSVRTGRKRETTGRTSKWGVLRRIHATAAALGVVCRRQRSYDATRLPTFKGPDWAKLRVMAAALTTVAEAPAVNVRRLIL